MPSASPTITGSPSRKLNATTAPKKRQADIIVTTQKDAGRFPKIDRRDLPFYFMRVEIKIVSGADGFEDCVRKICFNSDTTWIKSPILKNPSLLAGLVGLLIFRPLPLYSLGRPGPWL